MNTRRGRIDWVTLTLGCGLLVSGIAVWLIPRTVSRLPIDVLFTRFPATVWITLLVALGGIPTLLGVFGRTDRPTAPLTSPDVTTVQTEADHRPEPLGTSIDQLIDRAIDPDLTRNLRQEAKDDLEAELRELAIEILIAKGDLDRETARETVRTGAWSDDARATVVLGDSSVQSPPTYLWIVDLLRRENAYRRRIRHALVEIRDLDRATIDARSLEVTQS